MLLSIQVTAFTGLLLMNTFFFMICLNGFLTPLKKNSADSGVPNFSFCLHNHQYFHVVVYIYIYLFSTVFVNFCSSLAKTSITVVNIFCEKISYLSYIEHGWVCSLVKSTIYPHKCSSLRLFLSHSHFYLCIQLSLSVFSFSKSVINHRGVIANRNSI